ncbi:MAG TPA: hypothetical protein VFP84_06735 [Kofleriaceae bacterium]|nr:hypothetical protein [Kofleriaceae bacterium]
MLGALSAVFVLASPWVLYWTLSHAQVGVAALALIGWAIVRAIPIVISAQRAQRLVALRLSAIAIGFAVLGWASNNGTWLLILPSATQATFGGTFLRSLATTPMIEHFARMVKPALSPGELAHCRAWTAVWGWYLIALAALGLVLARWASLAVWTAYVGVVSYALVGVLFAIEYVVRKLRFRDYGKNPVDWLLRKLFPPPPALT